MLIWNHFTNLNKYEMFVKLPHIHNFSNGLFCWCTFINVFISSNQCSPSNLFWNKRRLSLKYLGGDRLCPKHILPNSWEQIDVTNRSIGFFIFFVSKKISRDRRQKRWTNKQKLKQKPFQTFAQNLGVKRFSTKIFVLDHLEPLFDATFLGVRSRAVPNANLGLIIRTENDILEVFGVFATNHFWDHTTKFRKKMLGMRMQISRHMAWGLFTCSFQ